MLTELFTIFGGTIFSAANAIYEADKKRESDLIIHDYINHGNEVMQQAENDKQRFIEKITNKKRERELHNKASAMSKEEKGKFLSAGICKYLKQGDFSSGYLKEAYDSAKDPISLLYLIDGDLYMKKILLAKEGIIDQHDANYGVHVQEILNKKDLVEYTSKKWLIQLAFLKWMDFELRQNGVEPLLFTNSMQFSSNLQSNHLELMKRGTVSSRGFLINPNIIYFWFSNRAGNVIY